MGLFKKKKKRDISNLPELPNFEEPPRETKSVPAYDSAFSKPPREKFLDTGPIIGTGPDKVAKRSGETIPIREPAFIKPKQNYSERDTDKRLNDVLPPLKDELDNDSPFKTDKDFAIENSLKKPIVPTPTKFRGGKEFAIPKNVIKEKPVFVQIDDYRDAMNNIEILKQKVREVEFILDKLNEIKSQEQLEISNCETSLNKIKEKLVEIDKKLFEV
jgi:hypothetical protein